MNITLIGKGKLGLALKALRETNEYSVLLLDRSWRSRTDQLRASDLIILTVADGSLHALASELAKVLADTNVTVIHCSGSESSKVLAPLSDISLNTASAHPVFAFSSPEETLKHFAGSTVVIEGDVDACETSRTLFEALSAQVVLAPTLDKHRYHAATVMASNLVLAQVSLASRLAAVAGIPIKDAETMLVGLALKNLETAQHLGLKDALTGPIRRNDINTVENHLNALNADTKTVYRALSREALELTRALHADHDPRLSELLK